MSTLDGTMVDQLVNQAFASAIAAIDSLASTLIRLSPAAYEEACARIAASDREDNILAYELTRTAARLNRPGLESGADSGESAQGPEFDADPSIWEIHLVVETDDETEVERIEEAVALAVCPVPVTEMTPEHHCAIAWMLQTTLLQGDSANEWRHMLNR